MYACEVLQSGILCHGGQKKNKKINRFIYKGLHHLFLSLLLSDRAISYSVRAVERYGITLGVPGGVSGGGGGGERFLDKDNPLRLLVGRVGRFFSFSVPPSSSDPRERTATGAPLMEL